MADKSAIEWCDATWNFLAGCTKVSEGCANCYALRDSWRIMHNPKHPARYDGVVERGPDGLPRWTGTVNVDEAALDQPLRWKKPRRIFVDSMSDLFHERVPDSVIAATWGIMARCPQHTFLVLTKRADRMHDLLNRHTSNARPYNVYIENGVIIKDAEGQDVPWPLENVVLMVTAENQRLADKRILLLLATPAAAHGVSLEPMLGPIDLTGRPPLGWGAYGAYHEERLWPNALTGVTFTNDGSVFSRDNPKLDHVIAGGESGPDARPTHPDWVRSVRDQCQESGTPFLFKGWGDWLPFDHDVDAQGLDVSGKYVIERESKDEVWVWRRVGKRAAGRLLDGREWDEYPELAK